MTCTNWFLTILAVVTFGIVVWPGCNCAGASDLIVGIAMLLVLILAWTWVECKPCKIQNTKTAPVKKKVIKKTVKKKK